jgi:5-methylcytosine-specific restriction enzyme A
VLTHKCPHLGCNEIIPLNQQYCEKHKAAYDNEIRHGADKQFNDFYHSSEWIKTQGLVMMKYHGLCVYSYVVEHKVAQADAAHHIIELREDWSKRLSMSNLIPLSATVHDGVIRSLYFQSRESKQRAQRMLFECLIKFYEEFRG